MLTISPAPPALYMVPGTERCLSGLPSASSLVFSLFFETGPHKQKGSLKFNTQPRTTLHCWSLIFLLPPPHCWDYSCTLTQCCRARDLRHSREAAFWPASRQDLRALKYLLRAPALPPPLAPSLRALLLPPSGNLRGWESVTDSSLSEFQKTLARSNI